MPCAPDAGVGVERRLVHELRIQHDVIGRFQARLGDRHFEGLHAGHDALALVEPAFHFECIGGAVCAFGVILQFPHDDVLEHGFPCPCMGRIRIRHLRDPTLL
jgi:hypothetical protein